MKIRCINKHVEEGDCKFQIASRKSPNLMMNPNPRWASVAYLLLISMSKLLPWESTTAEPPDGAARDLVARDAGGRTHSGVMRRRRWRSRCSQRARPLGGGALEAATWVERRPAARKGCCGDCSREWEERKGVSQLGFPDQLRHYILGGISCQPPDWNGWSRSHRD